MCARSNERRQRQQRRWRQQHLPLPRPYPDLYRQRQLPPPQRVFANGLGDLGSIPGRVIPKTQKIVLDASLLSTQHYKVRIKGKVEQSRKGVAPSPTHWCSSYRKGSLRVTLDCGRQLYFTIYIYIYIYI